ncbi:hypothetical protein [Shouchella lonarensis]|uniref:Predicted small secreted protein n=1 Tax=Shouchella lonarensis TaxID=1464122 RepID=A0A1G6GGM8_9BACI|nr:hypothetical protein [Shouchella lonarensis]SDB81168.1 Predicted small secreted protein [Shouchella lonarensis]
MKHFSLGLSVGILLGYITAKACKKTSLSPEQILKKVKARAKKDCIVSDSWIQMEPETVERSGLTYDVYRGGITKATVDGPIHYEFLADRENGALLEFEQVS